MYSRSNNLLIFDRESVIKCVLRLTEVDKEGLYRKLL